MAPVIEKIADEHNDKLKVAKVDTDRNLALSQKYQIFSIPTLMVVKGGQIVKQQPGFVPEDRVKALLAEAGVEL
jgi:thioredoxin-like negative regulator of GroEL